ncbi:L-asparaginase [Grosmannia clavigera kw1407]|uniref:asparaginase n=1 Tax=Grosmannia clavigera (strain kw1407 / UAMH 11150) TaxID=655863 RepID=F0XAV9_GROCL|nr:L-asparaginase [Grosmannia clavigera kw1407]EFX05147.1 L-asparaginase [Grosmannia clavigera kw1407]
MDGLKRELISEASRRGLPNVIVFTTGGTIASSAQSATAMSGYQPSVGARGLVESVPELRDVANIWGVELCNILSKDMTSAMALRASQAIAAELAYPDVAGAVLTHGTDTLEETAFLLDATIASSKPVVLVGSMRPASALSADGPMNIFQAVSVAACTAARGRGTMIVTNDRIGSAWYTEKHHANSVDSFYSAEQGQLGVFLEHRPVFFYGPAVPTGKVVLDVTACTALPQVDVLFGHQDANTALITAAAASGARGLVFCNVGNGSWNAEAKAVAKKLYDETDIPIVFSRRPEIGYALQLQGDDWAIPSGCLSPQKARILLQLCLQAGKTFAETKSVFLRTMGL